MGLAAVDNNLKHYRAISPWQASSIEDKDDECYHVIAVKTTKNSTGNLPEPEKLQVYKSQKEAEISDLGYAAYIAMAHPSEVVKTTNDVTLGDGSVTSCRGDRTSRDLTVDDVYDEDYTNSPLTPGAFYTTSVRAYGPKGGDQPSFSASQYTAPTRTASRRDKSYLIPIIAAACGAALLAIIITTVVCCLRRRKRSEKTNNNPQHVPRGRDNAMEMAAAGNDDDDGGGNIYANVANVSQLTINDPVPADRLEEVFNDRHANDDQIFRDEYGSIPDETSDPHEEYQRPENIEKNRFKNIFTYDHSRVVLSTTEGEPGSDYINANYVDGYNHTKKFIAAQGPLETTVDDFWRMVWEQDTATIVMVTNLVEKNKRKCTQYWPIRDSSTYGNVIVTFDDTTTLVDYVIRTFTLKQTTGNSRARTVTQFHFTSWPDHGVPQSPLGMMKFIRRAKTSNPPGRGPIVVHCSAGVGRTGTFIAIDAMQEMMAAEGRVDVRGFIAQMRNNRHSMVQTDDQYVFIYRALLEQHLYGDTEVEVANIHRHMHKLKAPSADPNEMGYEGEFKKLTRIPIDQENMRAANKPANKSKNRIVTSVPYDTTRVFLPQITGVKDSDYINASFIDGYRQRDGFLATQGPLRTTVDDFWRMVWEWKSYSIVMLTRLTENGQESCHKYWPDGRAEYGKISVELKETEKCPSFILRTFHVGHTEKTGPPFRVIRQFHFQDWLANGVPGNAGKMLDLIGKVEKQQQQSGNGPITVHCSSGAGRTGAFIALNTVLERVKAEGICDLFQTVKSMRYSRPHMVQTADQYLFCYQAVVEYLDSFDNYANFQ
ncbi:receptor-type tyrosine-protein phosphatase epsilon-like [Branchiostoma lanceolatum]|uniref:receptor-type tyrosine-protein phosphatase epsilon-like n=1 Tax=Branchiostoma lanceolatum TaxID=7740 RepID=UPI0034539A40